MRPSESGRGMSSPLSSDEAQSAHGSPDTKLTAFSPEDVRLRIRPDPITGGMPMDGTFRQVRSM